MLFFFITLSGCTSASADKSFKVERLSVTDGGATSRYNKIIILTVPGDAQRGEMANLEIEGIAGISYTATATYRVNYEKRTSYKTIVAPKSGIVIWNFKIDSNTNPGVYPIHISGGGQEINTSYRVIG